MRKATFGLAEDYDATGVKKTSMEFREPQYFYNEALSHLPKLCPLFAGPTCVRDNKNMDSEHHLLVHFDLLNLS